MLNNGKRWCLWLVDAKPDQLRRLTKVMQRVEAVRSVRLASKAATTRKFAATPALFCQIAQPTIDYLMVPSVSSERRKFIPMVMMSADVIASNLVFTVEGAALFHFGVLSSTMHMAWVRYTCGRLKSDFRYSKDIVYNNYPWPENPTRNQTLAIEQGAQAVVNARAKFRGSTLADLYDPLSMPHDLVQAHDALDRAIDASYARKSFASDAERVAFLFELYQKYTSLLPSQSKAGKPRKKQKKP